MANMINEVRLDMQKLKGVCKNGQMDELIEGDINDKKFNEL